jgi:hypothetical protein
MDSRLVNVYAREADKRERDPYGPDGGGRAVVVNGRGFAKWRRFNPGGELIWVDDCDGRPRALTPTQARVISFALSNVGGRMLTMRAMAASLGVNVSTVSRALAKAQAWGLLVYTVGRGRFAGLAIARYIKGDSFHGFQRMAARARVRRWSEAVKRRLSRLQFNVAPYIFEGGRGGDSLYLYLESLSISKGATLTAQLPWTAEDLREVGL